MQCKQCGTEMPPEAVFCQQCGARLGEAPAGEAAQPTPKEQFQAAAASRTVTALPEEDVWSGSYSSRAMFGPWVGCCVLSIALLIVAIWLGHAWAWWVALGVILAAWIWSGLVLLSRRLGVQYRLTTQRFFHETGLIRHVIDRIEVIDIDDVTCVQGIVERMLGLGTIRITSSDATHPQLTITGIEDALNVAGKIDEVRRAERMRRGLHIEQI